MVWCEDNEKIGLSDNRDGVVTRIGIAARLGIIEVVQVEAEKMKVEGRFKTVVSFRDTVRLLNKFLKDARVEELVQKQRYTQLQLIKGFNSSIRNLI
jgi:hypothetical protein